MPDSLRLALGTLTAIPVPPPRRVDRSVARGAMLLAPLVGLVLGVVAATVLTLIRVVAPDDRSIEAVDLLGAVLALVVLALLTRGLHLDGLADTADGLGVKATGDGAAEQRLAVMRAPDVGAFGVGDDRARAPRPGRGADRVLARRATAASRSSPPSSPGGSPPPGAAPRPWPPARADGLGPVMARSVPVPAAVVVTVAERARRGRARPPRRRRRAADRPGPGRGAARRAGRRGVGAAPRAPDGSAASRATSWAPSWSCATAAALVTAALAL